MMKVENSSCKYSRFLKIHEKNSKIHDIVCNELSRHLYYIHALILWITLKAGVNLISFPFEK